MIRETDSRDTAAVPSTEVGAGEPVTSVSPTPPGRARRAARGLRRRRTWIPLLVILLAVCGGVYWFVIRTPATADATTAATTTTRSVAASLTTLEKSVSTTGTLTPAVQESVNFAASGTVTAVNVKAGDTVTAGQVLATIDTLSLNADVLSAKATLASAQAKLADDTTNEASTEQLAADAAAVDVATAKVTTAETALSAASLVAPVDGIVAALNLTVGQTVSAGGATSGASTSGAGGAGSTGSTATTSSSTAQVQIVGTTSWVVDVSVDDTQVGLVKAGDQAELTVSGLDTPVFGTISSVGLISTATGTTASYPVVVAVTGNPAGLHDGSTATVALVYERRSNVLTVPSTAVHTVDGGTVVHQTVDGVQVDTPVTTGETANGTTEITAGLAEGDEVLVTVTTGGGTRTGAGTGQQNQQFPTGAFPTGAFPTGGFPGGAGGAGFPGGN